jgi:hypothetical protein
MTQLKNDQNQMSRDLTDLRAEVEKFITLGDLKQVGGRVEGSRTRLVTSEVLGRGYWLYPIRLINIELT